MLRKTSALIFGLLIFGQTMPASADTLIGHYLNATAKIRKVTYAGALGRFRHRGHDKQQVLKNFNKAYQEPVRAAKAEQGVPMNRELRPTFLGIRKDIYHSLLAKKVTKIRTAALNDTISWIKQISALKDGCPNIKALQAYLPQLEALAKETVKTSSTKKGMKASLKSSLNLPMSLAKNWGISTKSASFQEFEHFYRWQVSAHSLGLGKDLLSQSTTQTWQAIDKQLEAQLVEAR